jgi:hypothetical protein
MVRGLLDRVRACTVDADAAAAFVGAPPAAARALAQRGRPTWRDVRARFGGAAGLAAGCARPLPSLSDAEYAVEISAKNGGRGMVSFAQKTLKTRNRAVH